jgi:altronate hydrolase
MKLALRINPNDNIAVCLQAIAKGTLVEGVVALSDIPKGHKIALQAMEPGASVIKYGSPIGKANQPILPGEHVHVHNVSTNLGDILNYEYQPDFSTTVISAKPRAIQVYKRADGRVGIRNEIWIIPTVGCIVSLAERIAKKFTALHEETSFYDGIHVFGHPFGCSQMGDDLSNTRATLQNISLHPNAGAVLVLGLGCENNRIKEFASTYDHSGKRIHFLQTQDVEDEIEVALEVLEAFYEQMKEDKREAADISNLAVGLKCGGSDAFSGITANPLVGRFSDYLTALGGTTVLTEVPEMFGAETILMGRAKDRSVFDKTVHIINEFKAYYKAHDQVIYDNPSPGNKDGGITTLEDKSLGCTQKGGTGIVVDVLNHTERLKTKGLNLISAPGNDLVSTTTLGMCGCQLVLFTTGRGTPFGGFIPTLKISSNTDIAKRKPNWIDFNAGRLVDGDDPDQVLDDLIEMIIATVNGKKTNNEQNDFREIAIFKDGVTL